MARPIKKGLEYFPLDVDFFSDKKVKILKARYGADGVVLYMYLLCEIYKNGYYLALDDDYEYLIADELSMSDQKVMQVINFLLGRSLFDYTLFKSDKVLTSAGIQRRFQLAIKERAKKTPIIIEKFWILKKEETETFIKFTQNQGYSQKNTDYSENNSNISENNATKERKEKKSIVLKESSEAEAIITELPYIASDFEMKCVDKLIQSCIKVYPNSKVPLTDAEKTKWHLEINRMLRIDKRCELEIDQALNYAINDPFWKTNIRSASKFREKFETLYIQSKGKHSNKSKTLNRFNDFPQRNYTSSDYCNLEQHLLNKREG